MKTKLLVSLFLLIGTKMPAQDSLKFISGTTGAGCYAIKIYDYNYLITGTGSTLRIYDMTTGVPFDTVWEYRYKSNISDLAIKNNYLYVAANFDGLTKWDLTEVYNPQMIFEIGAATSFSQTPVLDISISNDTIFLAQFSKMSAYKDLGNTCDFITDFGNVTGFGKIYGADVKNGIVAYTVADLFSQNGVYLYETSNFTQLGFYPQPFCWPENVIWGKNNNLLHVLGGTNGAIGYFYTLEVDTPNSPQLIFSDTINGFPGWAVADAINAENINDTIYVATEAGLQPGGPPDTTFIHVYDATDTSGIHLIKYLPAGLWHFDVAVDDSKYHVASEWYGILSVDISSFSNPVVLGKTKTGGWNMSSDKYGNYLAVGNEGYGLKLYDISNLSVPALINVNELLGFCSNVKFSDDGNYIYATYMTTQGFRVFENVTLTPVDSITQILGTDRMQVWQNRVYITKKVTNVLNIVDVTNPANVSLINTISLQINDMFASENKLFITNNDSIFVNDIAGGNFQWIASAPLLANQNARALAVFGNEVYVFVTNKGLVKYELVFDNPGYSLNEISTFEMPDGEPNFMVADIFGLYLSYHDKGLYSFDRQSLDQKSYFRGELSFKGYSTQWGVQDLFCKDSLIFLVEYFSQTTILTNNNNFTVSVSENISDELSFTVFPNPFSQSVTIHYKFPESEKVTLEIFDVFGRMVKQAAGIKGNQKIDCGNLRNGLYLLQLRKNNIVTGQKKIIKL